MKDTPLDLLKGTLDVLILKTLSREPMHGYGISRHLRAARDEALQVQEGALYPSIRRLEERGFLSACWEGPDTGRQAKVDALAPAGVQELRRGISAWQGYVDGMARVLGGAGA